MYIPSQIIIYNCTIIMNDNNYNYYYSKIRCYGNVIVISCSILIPSTYSRGFQRFLSSIIKRLFKLSTANLPKTTLHDYYAISSYAVTLYFSLFSLFSPIGMETEQLIHHQHHNNPSNENNIHNYRSIDNSQSKNSSTHNQCAFYKGRNRIEGYPEERFV